MSFEHTEDFFGSVAFRASDDFKCVWNFSNDFLQQLFPVGERAAHQLLLLIRLCPTFVKQDVENFVAELVVAILER